MQSFTKEFYIKLGITLKELNSVSSELALPTEIKLSPFARPRRIEMLHEAIGWSTGRSQTKRIITPIYTTGDFVVAIGKPGKEAAPDFKRRHYITGVIMNNKNDMNPFILKKGEKVGDDLTFSALFEHIEHLMRADLFGLEILAMFLFRMAFMLDHTKDARGHWRFVFPTQSLATLKARIPEVGSFPVEVFLYFLDVLALNEDVKMHTLGHENAQHDYGRINTLLTFVHIIAVFLGRRSLAKFAGMFARPPAGMAPIPKIKGLFETFPLLSPSFMHTQ